ncbi:3-hydroxyacid dehydrogenase [Nitrospira japonica]|uniref:3-hydroxyacid dehydrogenase n=1 Tax=Nitrospira japonica TaxID=1325564 RepID=A0A1W1I2B5_9BACT|nr:NAD(P)-dependent oxidoreductase [Nitrospira japonica]SLM47137.1 3-hydroxyacid dehydrogenase [Nitrospira japonica]
MTPPGTVALLGTGLLGGAIAERLHHSGLSVIAYNRTASKTRALRSQGLVIAEHPEDAVAQAEGILLVLTDAAAIGSILLNPPCAQRLSGKTVIQMGTIGPDESLTLQRDLRVCGADYCEAPVLGSLAEAKAGTLLVMVGATVGQFEAWRPVWNALSRHPRLIGPVGRAAALKLALNQLIAAQIAAFSLSLGAVQRSGIAPDTFMAILRESALFAPAFDKKLPRLLARQYDNPNFSVAHLLKDLRLFGRLAAGLHLQSESADGVGRLLEATIAKGLQDVDYSALFDVINPPDTTGPQ